MGSSLSKEGIGIGIAAAFLFVAAVCIFVFTGNVIIAAVSAVIGVMLLVFALTKFKEDSGSDKKVEVSEETTVVQEPVAQASAIEESEPKAEDVKEPSADEPKQEPVVQASAIEESEPKAEDVEASKEEPAESIPEKSESHSVDEMPNSEPADAGDGAVPESVEDAKPAEAKNQEMNGDFLSKLVASKDACDKVADIPYARVKPAPVPVADAPEKESEAPIEGAVETSAEPDEESDTFTDYSPEALVRRAAWNKGLRCRREYGDHKIQVAFVKPRVAVYVLDPSEDIADLEAIKGEGWTVLRFDETAVTDGHSEGDEIADAVKANLHAQKTAKKKSSKK